MKVTVIGTVTGACLAYLGHGVTCVDTARMNHPILIDGRNLFDPALARKAGFDYCGIGRATRTANGRSARSNGARTAASH